MSLARFTLDPYRVHVNNPTQSKARALRRDMEPAPSQEKIVHSLASGAQKHLRSRGRMSLRNFMHRDYLPPLRCTSLSQIEISSVKDSGNADARRSLQAAVDAARPGDTIVLAPGMVRERKKRTREAQGFTMLYVILYPTLDVVTARVLSLFRAYCRSPLEKEYVKCSKSELIFTISCCPVHLLCCPSVLVSSLVRYVVRRKKSTRTHHTRQQRTNRPSC